MKAFATIYKKLFKLYLVAAIISLGGSFNSASAQQNIYIDPDVYSAMTSQQNSNTNPQNSMILPLQFNSPNSMYVFPGDNILVDTITLNANPGPANNGGSPAWGIFFDLIGLGSSNVIVTQMSTANAGAANVSFSVTVYTYDGTALGGPVGSGHGSSSAGWTNLGTVPAVQGTTSNGISLIFSVPPILVPAGDTTGVALVFSTVGPRYFGSGTPPYEIYSDANLKLVTGDVRSVPFTTGGSFFASRALCGEVRYVVEQPVSCNFVWSTQTSGVTTGFSTVKAVSDMVGWAAGASGVVRRTTDGGLTWTAASTTGQINGTIYCMDALDANTAWVSSSPAATYIYKTTNGGTNWTQVYTLAGGFINGLQMINATTGYASGDPVGSVWELLITTNGGDNWTQMPSAPAQVGTEAGWNNSFQIIGTNMWVGTNNTRVYMSTNLGLNWTSPATTGQLNSYGLHFNSASLGINVGTIVQKSTDGGTSWVTTAGAVPGTGNMLGAEGYGTDYFWVIRGTGIYYTSNGGTSWQAVPGITTAGTQTGIDFAIVNGCPTGWVVANNGNIYAMKIITGVSNNNNELPSSYSLSQNYPNPFNPSTKISFALPKAGNVKLIVFDLLGREVTTLVNDFQTAGNHTIDFNAANLSSGVYFYRIEAGDFTATNKMLLVK